MLKRFFLPGVFLRESACLARTDSKSATKLRKYFILAKCFSVLGLKIKYLSLWALFNVEYHPLGGRYCVWKYGLRFFQQRGCVGIAG